MAASPTNMNFDNIFEERFLADINLEIGDTLSPSLFGTIENTLEDIVLSRIPMWVINENIEDADIKDNVKQNILNYFNKT